jgi:virulence-associated protein VagC
MGSGIAANRTQSIRIPTQVLNQVMKVTISNCFQETQLTEQTWN